MTPQERKVMGLALEALEGFYEYGYDRRECFEHITAIKEALAQPEQEPVATVTSETGDPDITMSWWHEPALPVGTPLYTTPPQTKEPEQEPVAVVTGVYGGRFTYAPFKSTVVLPVGAALYLQTPQRTWVGLTPQERDEINEQVYGAVPHHVAFHHAIEAKLKDKNHG